ncbi:unnamed protein product [Vitrella brassicaformis CCMP3155]|uniref:Uncharacterized protein n=2 Tax=Vitrella brassicaformis TaxID=1169539 RepID=A0A0G4EMU5_VITBC|nr:unnamed protein product [Vitrella brassicaformis CCMP3155]|eukprot:CEL98491.1 unnamed protein product [Vitrella brassicaformis CCMP3155]
MRAPPGAVLQPIAVESWLAWQKEALQPLSRGQARCSGPPPSSSPSRTTRILQNAWQNRQGVRPFIKDPYEQTMPTDLTPIGPRLPSIGGAINRMDPRIEPPHLHLSDGGVRLHQELNKSREGGTRMVGIGPLEASTPVDMYEKQVARSGVDLEASARAAQGGVTVNTEKGLDELTSKTDGVGGFVQSVPLNVLSRTPPAANLVKLHHYLHVEAPRQTEWAAKIVFKEDQPPRPPPIRVQTRPAPEELTPPSPFQYSDGSAIDYHRDFTRKMMAWQRAVLDRNATRIQRAWRQRGGKKLSFWRGKPMERLSAKANRFMDGWKTAQKTAKERNEEEQLRVQERAATLFKDWIPSEEKPPVEALLRPATAPVAPSAVEGLLGEPSPPPAAIADLISGRPSAAPSAPPSASRAPQGLLPETPSAVQGLVSPPSAIEGLVSEQQPPPTLAGLVDEERPAIAGLLPEYGEAPSALAGLVPSAVSTSPREERRRVSEETLQQMSVLLRRAEERRRKQRTEEQHDRASSIREQFRTVRPVAFHQMRMREELHRTEDRRRKSIRQKSAKKAKVEGKARRRSLLEGLLGPTQLADFFAPPTRTTPVTPAMIPPPAAVSEEEGLQRQTAARDIQRAFRGSLVRQETSARKARLAHEVLFGFEVKLGHLLVCLVQQLEWGEAALYIQRHFRGMRGRKMAATRRKEEQERQAALCIQRLFRGRKGKTIATKIRHDRLKHDSAVRIQRLFRGRKARERADQMRSQELASGHLSFLSMDRILENLQRRLETVAENERQVMGKAPPSVSAPPTRRPTPIRRPPFATTLPEEVLERRPPERPAIHRPLEGTVQPQSAVVAEVHTLTNEILELLGQPPTELPSYQPQPPQEEEKSDGELQVAEERESVKEEAAEREDEERLELEPANRASDKPSRRTTLMSKVAFATLAFMRPPPEKKGKKKRAPMPMPAITKKGQRRDSKERDVSPVHVRLMRRQLERVERERVFQRRRDMLNLFTVQATAPDEHRQRSIATPGNDVQKLMRSVKAFQTAKAMAYQAAKGDGGKGKEPPPEGGKAAEAQPSAAAKAASKLKRVTVAAAARAAGPASSGRWGSEAESSAPSAESSSSSSEVDAKQFSRLRALTTAQRFAR